MSCGINTVRLPSSDRYVSRPSTSSTDFPACCICVNVFLGVDAGCIEINILKESGGDAWTSQHLGVSVRSCSCCV